MIFNWYRFWKVNLIDMLLFCFVYFKLQEVGVVLWKDIDKCCNYGCSSMSQWQQFSYGCSSVSQWQQFSYGCSSVSNTATFKLQCWQWSIHISCKTEVLICMMSILQLWMLQCQWHWSIHSCRIDTVTDTGASIAAGLTLSLPLKRL